MKDKKQKAKRKKKILFLRFALPQGNER